MWTPLQPHLCQAEVSSCTSNPSTATAPSLFRSRAFSESAVTWPGTRVAGRRLITGTLSKPPTSDRASALSRCPSHSSLGVYVQCGMRYTRVVGLGHVGPPAARCIRGRRTHNACPPHPPHANRTVLGWVSTNQSSQKVIGAGNVLAGNPCAIEWPSTPHVYGPFASSDGIVPVQDETNYFQVDAPGAGAGYRVVGTTEDAAGCRGVCESTSDCQSWTWDARNMSGPATVGKCFVRNDTLWYPNVTDGNPALVAAGRPWEFDGDNPTVVIDAVHGNLTALYRTDVDVGVGPQPMASLIGLATAPSWRGPYTLSGPYGGTLTTQQYPYDENEDPFIWKSKRGFHALFHANTWGDSRGKVFPVPANAGRLAYSVDGFLWTYSDTPPFNGTVAYSNGTHAPFARVERPVLLFDPSGTPTHLINGVQRYVNDDYTFTLIRRIDHS
eukprot:m.28165 g.28165  ORF g.28165 m.28165 type:complete len:441 (+) comp11997_c0_seq1:700-2022(+)